MARGRFRRRGFRRLKRSATAFAPAKSGGGNLTWEAAGTTCWSTIDPIFNFKSPQYEIVCDGATETYATYGLILIPINTSRGTVTLLRVRGFLGVSDGEIYNNNPAGLREKTVHFMLQLVPHEPTQINTFDATQLLSGNLATNQESNRIIMQWVRGPGGDHSTPGLDPSDPGIPNTRQNTWFREIDVRTKRRFDRTQWGLVLSASVKDPEGAEENRVYVNFRMLFRTDDGI